jgi:hypothetical protein
MRVQTEGTAKARYDELDPIREPYLRRARRCSKFTLPALIPPLGWTGTTDLPEPWNNLGARGVNNLSSKLLLTLFPPGSACFRNELDPKSRLDVQQRFLEKGDDRGFTAWLAAADSAMAEIEKRFVTWTEANQHRVSLGEVFKHLIVAGNSLLYSPESGGLRVFRLDKFVVLRDPYGKVLEIVVKECVAKAALDDSAKAVLQDAPVADADKLASESADPQAREQAAKTVDLYTHVYWTGRVYRVYQELQGTVIPNTRGSYPADKCPWLPLRWTKIDGEDYGWGHVDSFLGDLTTLDMLSQALAEGAAAAARIIFLKKPGTVGKVKDLVEATNGGVVVMEHDALMALQVEKMHDFRTALERVQEIERSLAFSFLLNTAIQRSGERVTAEEIRYMAQELEDALGGVYSVLAQELQLPYVRRNLAVMAKQKAIPALPKDITPVIITGVEALGRGNDLNRLDTFLTGVAQTLGPEVIATTINPDEYMRRRAVALAVDPQGLIKTPEEIAQAQQTQQMQAMLQQLGPNAINQLGGIAQTHAANQSKEKIASEQAQRQQQDQQQRPAGAGG